MLMIGLCCLIYPPLAYALGYVMGMIATAIYNRTIAVRSIFIDSITAVCTKLGWDMWSTFEGWFTGAPSITGAGSAEPYPLGRGVVTFVMGSFMINTLVKYLPKATI
jgi:hypothetical protein